MCIKDKIKKLLELGNSPNQHEAELALARAQELMEKHGLESVEADPEFEQAVLLTQTRIWAWQKALTVLLNEHFHVETIIMHGGWDERGRTTRQVRMLGTPQNLKVAEYVYTFITRTCESLYKAYRKTGGSGKQAFFYGCIEGIYHKLQAEKKARERAYREETGQAMVFVGDAALARYFREQFPHTGSESAACRTRNGAAARAGHSAGEKVAIRQGLGTSGSPVRQLGGRA